jgi:cellulose synthase/poly-beta-1,6-N-acetylglucosamine synthase-like glycosyltransferase
VETLLTVYQYVLLGYFCGLNVLYALFTCVGLRAIVVIFVREFSQGTLRDLLERDVYKPVSILVPAHNEEVSIVSSVRSLLALQFPEFEVIVVSDGSEDETMQRLIDAFALAEQPWASRQDLPTAPVRRTFRSLSNPNLIVVDKERGGKADSLNAGLNLARYPLFAAVDADSMLDGEAILRASRLSVEDETLVAVGGTIRPLNAAVVQDGRITEVKIPKRWLERFQVLEYARAFFTGRAGWSHFKSLLIISGAFELFRRTAVLEAGGFLVGTVAEDMELVVRLHKHFLREGKPYNIRFTPDPICWSEVPSDLGTLRRQRNRWHRGLWETLWTHKDMLFNPPLPPAGAGRRPLFLVFRGARPGGGGLRLPAGDRRDHRRLPGPAVRHPVRDPGGPVRDALLPAGRRHRDLPVQPLPAPARPRGPVPGRVPGVRRLPAVPRAGADRGHRTGAVQAGQWGKMHRQGIRGTSAPAQEEQAPAGV